MTIPTGEEMQAVLDEIAAEMGRINGQIKVVEERIQPLRDEQNTLKERAKVLAEKLNEEVQYAHAQEQAIYEVYLQAKRMWEEYRESCRALKARDEQGINERSAELRTAIWDDDRLLRDLRREFESLERKWDLAQRKIKDAERYLSAQERLDRLTIGAPWREWAKDHQMDGARRIAHRGKLLLGDTMGLGKTLTSIAAIDMIRAMTSEASEDNPYVIETN